MNGVDRNDTILRLFICLYAEQNLYIDTIRKIFLNAGLPNNKYIYFLYIMNNKNEIETLINLSRKVGQAFCDKDTFEETSSSHIVQKWKYKNNIFQMTFPKIPCNEISAKNCYAQMKKKLREINLEAPSEFSFRLIGNYEKVEELVLLDELWEELLAGDEV